MVLIAGPSSSGKTTFAQRLGLQLRINGIKPVTISVDNYFVERDQTPRNEKGEYDVSVCYPGTFGMRVSKYVSIIGSIVFIGYIIVKKKL